MQAGAVGDRSWKDFRLADPKWTVGDFLERDAERCPAETRQCGEEGVEELPCAARTDDGEWRAFPTLILRKDHRIEEKCDEIRKMISMKMGEQDVGNPVSIHAGFHEVHQCARAKIK